MSIERRELLNKVTSMNDRDELRMLRSAINDRIREIGNSIKYDLHPGDTVIVQGNKVGNEIGTIIKVNRTRAVVEINNIKWNVPFSLITKENSND